MRGNRFERTVARRYAPAFGWAELCPVLWADPLGMVLLMPRADPVTESEVRAAEIDHYPAPPYEPKAQDWGRLADGRVVAVDFADIAHHADSLRDQIAYLESKMPDTKKPPVGGLQRPRRGVSREDPRSTYRSR